MTPTNTKVPPPYVGINYSDTELVGMWLRFITILQQPENIQKTMLQKLKEKSPHFSTALASFGPEYMTKITILVRQEWFYGFLSLYECDRFLEEEEVGSYLCRASSTQAFHFSMDYLVQKKSSNGILVKSIPGGFDVDGKSFVQIEDAINLWKQWLVRPFVSKLLKQAWFWGDIDSEKAKELLRGKPIGTYLFRFSSVTGCFALSFVDETNAIRKGLITKTPNGYQNEGSASFFPTVLDLVESYKKTGLFTVGLDKNAHYLI